MVFAPFYDIHISVAYTPWPAAHRPGPSRSADAVYPRSDRHAWAQRGPKRPASAWGACPQLHPGSPRAQCLPRELTSGAGWPAAAPAQGMRLHRPVPA